MEVDSIQLDDKDNCTGDRSIENLTSPGSPDANNVFGEPLLNPQVGDKYQVDIPSLITESRRNELLANPFNSQTAEASYAFLVGLPIAITWVRDGEYSADNGGSGLHKKSNDTADTIRSLEARNGKKGQTWPRKKSSELNVDEHGGMSRAENSEPVLAVEMNLKRSYRNKSYYAVPGVSTDPWTDAEVDSFLLGLYIFGKNFLQIKRFMGNKGLGVVISFYYGKFYRSEAYRRWSGSRKVRRKKCVTGRKIFSGWRQQELLSRLSMHVPEEPQKSLLEGYKSFAEGRTSFEEYVSYLKSIVGIPVLVEVIGIGKGKEDLTGIAMDPRKSNHDILVCPHLPTAQACSSLTSKEIVNLLTGGFRLSKGRCSDIFWEAVWPRLLAKGWHSEQPKNQGYISSKNYLVFLMPGVKKFSRRKLAKGEHYFDSVSDVLNKVASEPKLIELESEESSAGCQNEQDAWSPETGSDQVLDPDQLRPYVPASKKPKSKIGPSLATAEGSVASSPKKSTSSGASKRKKAASSLKRPAPSKPAATPVLSPTEEVEDEPSPKSLKRKKKKTKTKESEPAPSKMALLAHPPFESEDVSTPQARVISESEKTQALLEASSTIVSEGGSFDDVAREALKVAEEVVCEGGSTATPNPPVASIEDPPLIVEDFLVELQKDLTLSEADILPKPTSPVPAPTQTMTGLERSTPIILDDDDFFNRLERSRSSKVAAKSVPIPEPSIGDKAKGKQSMEGDLSLRTPPTRRMKSHARCEHGVTSSGGGLETESSEEPVPSPAKRNPIEVPKGPLEDFAVPPTKTPYDEGSCNSSRSFPWIVNLNAMLDEIWSEKSFQELTNEPLQAGNREGMRMLSMALFTNFIYSQKTEATFAKEQQALIQLRDENKRLVAELAETNATFGTATETAALDNDSQKKVEGYKKTCNEELAKLREELRKENASREEAWKALEKERRIYEESLQSEKVALELAIEEEKRLREAAEARLQAVEDELQETTTKLKKNEAALNEARAKIRTAVADYKKSTAFENFVESRRQRWLSDFRKSPSYLVEMRQATIEGAKKVLEKLDALHPEWNVYDEVKRHPS